MIEVCQFCGASKIVPGPRNQRMTGYCASAKCRIKALQSLAELDMLTKEEADELQGG